MLWTFDAVGALDSAVLLCRSAADAESDFCFPFRTELEPQVFWSSLISSIHIFAVNCNIAQALLFATV